MSSDVQGEQGDSVGLDKFTKAALFTFHPSVEGGYTVDNGGPTNYGITQNALDGFNRENGFKDMSVKDMTPDDAKFVAKEGYFNKPGLNALPDRTAVAAFDYSVNSGPHQAIKDLQRVVGVKADGAMGPETQKAINSYIKDNGEDALLALYVDKRQQLMQSLISTNPGKYGAYANGWSTRIGNLKSYLGINDNSQQ